MLSRVVPEEKAKVTFLYIAFGTDVTETLLNCKTVLNGRTQLAGETEFEGKKMVGGETILDVVTLG